jgi:hypothetical protein
MIYGSRLILMENGPESPIRKIEEGKEEEYIIVS